MPFRLSSFRLNLIDVHKIDGKHYKDSEYSNLFKYIMEIESPKDLSFDTILKLSHGSSMPLREAQN